MKNNKKLTILIDMDDTIEDLLPAWVSELNERFGTSVSVDDITEWDMTKSFPMLTEEQIFSCLYEEDFWKKVKPKDGAVEKIKKMIDYGHSVYICTNSDYRTLPYKMEHVLFKYFDYLTWDNVIVAGKKQMINADVLIDDAVHNLVGGNYLKVLFDAPHNRTFDESTEHMIRAKSWSDIHFDGSDQEEVCTDERSRTSA